jgi:hypothetical protein
MDQIELFRLNENYKNGLIWTIGSERFSKKLHIFEGIVSSMAVGATRVNSFRSLCPKKLVLFHNFHPIEISLLTHLQRGQRAIESVQIKTSYVTLNFLCFYLALIWTFSSIL